MIWPVTTAFFAIDSFNTGSVDSNTTLSNHIFASGSVTFGTQWYDQNMSVRFHSGSLTISRPVNSTSFSRRDLRFVVKDLKSKYIQGQPARARLFVRDRNLADESVRIPIQLSSIALKEVYYRIKDADNKKILIPFRKSDTTNSTRVSTDSDGMFFDIPISVLPNNRAYTIELLVIDRGSSSVYETGVRFRVNP